MSRRGQLVGLTGPIGAGKSVVAAVFAARGVELIDLDRLGHEGLSRPEVQRQLRRAFGPEIFDARGRVSRPALAARAFATAAACRELNAAVHPPLVAEARRRMRAARRRPGGVAVVVGRLLEEFGLDLETDRVVRVTAGFRRRAAWLKRSRGWTAAELRRRERRARLARRSRRNGRRPPSSELRNSGTLTGLRRQARQLWKKLEEE